MRFKLYSYDEIKTMDITKAQLITRSLDKDTTFDFALPQQALDSFVRETGLPYDFVLSTSVWIYASDYKGMFSACYEVQKQIEQLNYGPACNIKEI